MNVKHMIMTQITLSFEIFAKKKRRRYKKFKKFAMKREICEEFSVF